VQQQQLVPQLHVAGDVQQQQLVPQLHVAGDQLQLLQQLQNVGLLQQLMQLMQQQQLQQQLQGGHLLQHHQLQLQQQGGQLPDHIVVVGPLSEPSVDQEEDGDLTNFQSKYGNLCFFAYLSSQPCLRIHDILVWFRIRIRGSMQKKFFFYIFYAYYFLKLHLHRYF
jgi:hypothetical protein